MSLSIQGCYTSEVTCQAQWLRGRTSNSRLRGPGFASSAAVLKPWVSIFTLHCSSSPGCIKVYLAIDSGGYVYEHPSCINCSTWLDASREVEMVSDWTVLSRKCKALWAILKVGYCTIQELTFLLLPLRRWHFLYTGLSSLNILCRIWVC